MVRYDLQQSKKKQCILRQEKQDEIEKNKSDLVAKITDLEKDRVKLQAELDFKVSKPFLWYSWVKLLFFYIDTESWCYERQALVKQIHCWYSETTWNDRD